MAEKQVMVVGIDDSTFSWYALEWTLDHLLCPANDDPVFKLVLVYAKPSVTSTAGLVVGPGVTDAFPLVDAELKRTTAKIVDRAKELCTKKSVKNPIVEVVHGDPRNVLCDAVEKHHASILVVGSHGYGTLKRAVLGSVSDYCAHNAHCNVMVVKKPKTKQ
ncbi:hypothetical protein RIF29_24933 [Crotalaria pallida]|uniref:UspA domain-containing protein n=1 Tax=Crotalaria pallida TaxID=3830 RepID=A0AAN9HZC5_CROPI